MAVVSYADHDTFFAMSGGFITDTSRNWVQNQWNNASSSFNHPFFNKMKTFAQDFSNGSLIERAKAILRSAGADTGWDNTIRELRSLAECQTANPEMVRWIMAYPYLRQMYHDNEIAGYPGIYIDPEPDVLETSDYMHVTNGLYMQDDEGNDVFNLYYSFDMDGNPVHHQDAMPFTDQVILKDTWEYIKFIMSQDPDIDPTNQYGDPR